MNIVKVGLAQIGSDGLRRLIDHIDRQKPLCLNGRIVDANGDP